MTAVGGVVVAYTFALEDAERVAIWTGVSLVLVALIGLIGVLGAAWIQAGRNAKQAAVVASTVATTVGPPNGMSLIEYAEKTAVKQAEQDEKITEIHEAVTDLREVVNRAISDIAGAQAETMLRVKALENLAGTSPTTHHTPHLRATGSGN
jgi:hypothetical protein